MILVPRSWLEDWLWHLQVEIPTISDKKGGFNLTVSNGLCTHFKIAKIDTVKNPSNLQITASGLEIFCRLRWDAKSRLLPDLGGEVVAQVSNAELGGPISIVSDGLQPPLPKAINAHGCSGTIKAEFTFTGSGVSTVLEFLKPLIQSIINDRLADTQTTIRTGRLTMIDLHGPFKPFQTSEPLKRKGKRKGRITSDGMFD
eukprot:g1434.t1